MRALIFAQAVVGLRAVRCDVAQLRLAHSARPPRPASKLSALIGGATQFELERWRAE